LKWVSCSLGNMDGHMLLHIVVCHCSSGSSRSVFRHMSLPWILNSNMLSPYSHTRFLSIKIHLERLSMSLGSSLANTAEFCLVTLTANAEHGYHLPVASFLKINSIWLRVICCLFSFMFAMT